MEKLKPILAQQFWIVAGVALIAPVVGWWMMTGHAETVFEDRSSKLDQTYQQLAVPPRENERWSNGLKAINDADQKELERAEERVYQIQSKLKYWPATVRDVMEECPEFSPPLGSSDEVATVPILYAEAYMGQIRDLRMLVNPMITDPKELLSLARSPLEGTIVLPAGVIPQVPEDKWNGPGASPPTWYEIWSEQEDIWLMRSLLEAVARVNKGAERINESPIRRIDEIALFGGNRRTEDELAATSTSEESEDDGDTESYASDFGGEDGQGGSADVDIPLGEEFSEIALKSGGGATSEGSEEGGSYAMVEEETYEEEDDGELAEDAPPPRYVDDNPDEPYRTRGFKLKVFMDHRHISDFLVALSDANWPVEIIRVHYAQAVPDPHIVSTQGSTGEGTGSTPTYRQPSTFAPTTNPRSLTGSSLTGSPSPFSGGESEGGPFSTTSGEGENLLLDPKLQKLKEDLGKARRRQAIAFSDPMMTEVVVVGLMTIYKTPEAEQPTEDQLAEEAGTNPAPVTSETTSPDESDTDEATPAPANTQPVDPTGTPAAPTSPDDASGDQPPANKQNETASPPGEGVTDE